MKVILHIATEVAFMDREVQVAVECSAAPRIGDCSATQVAIVVIWWIIVLPIYWFWVFCDRCIVWFDKKE